MSTNERFDQESARSVRPPTITEQASLNQQPGAAEPVVCPPVNCKKVADVPSVVLPPLLLRAPQAAAYCGVSEATWWRWDAAGRIPRGRKVRAGVKCWSRPELEQWAALGCPTRKVFEARQSAQHNGRR